MKSINKPTETPLQQQYKALKAENPEAILFFRLGDFYEMFYEDAVLCSKILGLTLTARHKNTENTMPMCGFPHHQSEEYMATLVNMGYSVAFAEQIESTEKTMMKREITHIITPSTLLEGTHLEDTERYLVALYRDKTGYAIAVSEPTTGEFRTTYMHNYDAFIAEIHRLAPREILIHSDIFNDDKLINALPKCPIKLRNALSEAQQYQLLSTLLPPEPEKVLGTEGFLATINASSMILQYLSELSKNTPLALQKLVRYSPEQAVVLDKQTLSHLEIFVPLRADDKNMTLWDALEPCITALGKRKRRELMLRPSRNKSVLESRYMIIETLLKRSKSLETLIDRLQNVYDMERLLTKIMLRRATSRDIKTLQISINACFEVLTALPTSLINSVYILPTEVINTLQMLHNHIVMSLLDELPKGIHEGNMFRIGTDKELDKLIDIEQNGAQWLINYEAQVRLETGITTLKIKDTGAFGYAIEVSKSQVNKVPTEWKRKQTLVNAERYITDELSAFEADYSTCTAKKNALEEQLFHTLREYIMQHRDAINTLCSTISDIDTYQSLARTALLYNWSKPIITDTEGVLDIIDGKHPVVAKWSPEVFIPNSLHMHTKTSFQLITGPNMAGKSTYLRQSAIIIYLAQIGSYVPCKQCTYALTDRIFTRLGASDSVASGRSTFYTEMSEVVSILYAATKDSFLVLDEVGRGTSTFDGLSLAASLIEHLCNNLKARTLFATHYHELIKLVDTLPNAVNKHVSATFDGEKLIFHHRVKDGGAEESFGIGVAKMAGMPLDIVSRASQILNDLEHQKALISPQINLFS